MTPLKKIILIVVISVVTLVVASKIADRGYRHFWRPFFDKMDVVFKSDTDYDVLFLGNSTVHFGINPFFIDSICRVNSYNLGYGGANIITMDMLLHAYLEKHPKPKAVVVSLDYSSFFYNGDFDNYFIFFYYLQNKYAVQYLSDKGFKTKLVKYLPFLKYSYFDDYSRGTVFTGFRRSPFEEHAIIYKGYINNNTDTLNHMAMATQEEYTCCVPEKKFVDTFYSLLNFCKTSGIKVLLLFPPRYYSVPPDPARVFKIDTLMRNTALRYTIPFYRYDTAGTFNQNEFSDNVHLNKPGAERYSALVGKRVDSLLKRD